MPEKRVRGKGRAVSRLQVEFFGRRVLFELRRDGLAVRPRYARSAWRIDFATLYDVASGQKSLRLL